MSTDTSGNVISQVRYTPFGEEAWDGGTVAPTDFGFTGQRNESGFGLMDYNARFYSAYLNRFIQPDSIVPDPKNPVAWDRYAYSANNPVKYNDPSGHCWGAFSWVRSLPSYGTTCNNLEMAWTIVTSPDTTVGEKVVAGAYIVGEGVAHGTAAVYGGITVRGAVSAACYEAATAGGTVAAAACSDGDCGNEAAAIQQTAQSVWDLNPFERGREIETMLGHNLAQNNPVIDYWNNVTGLARSIKSIDLGAQTYQSISRLTSTVQGYINTLANWSGNQSWAGVDIYSTQVTTRELLLAIPTGATQAQLDALYQLQASALQQGIVLTIVVVP
ncbi:MAG: hypothetical protein HUU38_16305 [Anaerolineales bacterium]|nr:hypothetical protein [Anaerolineales bacterium]